MLVAILSVRPVEAAPESPACRLLAASVRAETVPARRLAKQKEYNTRCRKSAHLPPPSKSQQPAKADSTGRATTASRPAAKTVQPFSKKAAPKAITGRLRPKKALVQRRRPVPPSVVTVSLYGSIADAIELVAEGGTVRVPTGAYNSPPYIYKRVTISGISDGLGSRPTLYGRITIFSPNVEINGIEIRKSNAQSEVNLNLLDVANGANAVLRNTYVGAEDCIKDGNNLNGAVLVRGSATFSQSTVNAGRCYALAIWNGIVSSTDAEFESSSDYAIVQSAGSSYFRRAKIVGTAALHIQDKGAMTVIDSTISTKSGYNWWFRDGDGANLYTSGNKFITK